MFDFLFGIIAIILLIFYAIHLFNLVCDIITSRKFWNLIGNIWSWCVYSIKMLWRGLFHAGVICGQVISFFGRGMLLASPGLYKAIKEILCGIGNAITATTRLLQDERTKKLELELKQREYMSQEEETAILRKTQFALDIREALKLKNAGAYEEFREMVHMLNCKYDKHKVHEAIKKFI